MKKELKSKIESTDKETDKMVYELYGLTEEEVKLVEVAGRELEYGVVEGIGDGVDIGLNKGAGG